MALNIGVYSAIISFINRYSGLIKVMQRSGLVPGIYVESFFREKNIANGHQYLLNPTEKYFIPGGKGTRIKTWKRK